MRILPYALITDFAGTTMKDDVAVLAAYCSDLTELNIPFTEEDLTRVSCDDDGWKT